MYNLRHLRKKWLVTGATGMLGRRFVETFAHECVAFCRTHAALPCSVVLGTLENHAAMGATIERLEPSLCWHFGACTDIARCETDGGYANLVNCQAASTIAEACARVGCRVVYMCTDSVFDGVRGGYSEKDLTNPVNNYARAKLGGESAVLDASPANISIRANIFGREPFVAARAKLYDWAVRSLREGREIVGFSDVIFNPISVDTLSEVLSDIVESGLNGGIWHVGTVQPTSKFEFLRAVAIANRLPAELVRQGTLGGARLGVPRPLNTSLLVSKIIGAGFRMPSVHDEILRVAQTYESS